MQPPKYDGQRVQGQPPTSLLIWITDAEPSTGGGGVGLRVRLGSIARPVNRNHLALNWLCANETDSGYVGELERLPLRLWGGDSESTVRSYTRGDMDSDERSFSYKHGAPSSDVQGQSKKLDTSFDVAAIKKNVNSHIYWIEQTAHTEWAKKHTVAAS